MIVRHQQLFRYILTAREHQLNISRPSHLRLYFDAPHGRYNQTTSGLDHWSQLVNGPYQYSERNEADKEINEQVGFLIKKCFFSLLMFFRILKEAINSSQDVVSF